MPPFIRNTLNPQQLKDWNEERMRRWISEYNMLYNKVVQFGQTLSKLIIEAERQRIHGNEERFCLEDLQTSKLDVDDQLNELIDSFPRRNMNRHWNMKNIRNLMNEVELIQIALECNYPHCCF